MTDETGRYVLETPLDVSGVRNMSTNRTVRVVAYAGDGAIASSALATFHRGGHGRAVLTFDGKPGALRVVVGPETASDSELAHLQTLSFTVPADQWRGGPKLRLAPVGLPAFYWEWCLVWRRDYTVTGRLLRADGSPVRGATVRALDVDFWWWWSSEEPVGEAVTDANGAFEIAFRRGCGWNWRWWWEQRAWRVDPALADLIVPLLAQTPVIGDVPPQAPIPDIRIFTSLLRQRSCGSRIPGAIAGQVQRAAERPFFHPGDLATLRSELLSALPASDSLRRLRLWPWWPWWPWLDCDADVVFRATVNENERDAVILDETVLQARRDIPGQLYVTLTAREKAKRFLPLTQGADAAV